MENGRNHHDISKDSIEDRVGGECEHPTPPNVAVHFGKGVRRFGDGCEHGAELEKEPNGSVTIDRVLPIPARRLVQVALSGSANPVSHAD